jgi:O-antigen biosynthesis protein
MKPADFVLWPAKHGRQGKGLGRWLSLGSGYLLSYRGSDSECLAAGWYWFDIEFAAFDARWEPALYPDYGDGYWEQLRISLRALLCSKARRIRGVVMFPRDVVELKLGAGVNDGFCVKHLRAKRIHRLRALLAMLIWRHGQRVGCRFWPRFAGAAEILIKSGLRVMATRTYEYHIEEITKFETREYRRWLCSYDSLALYADHAPADNDGPLLSVLVPVYNAHGRWLRACLDSVLAQTYQNWELCLVDDASSQREPLDVLAEYERKDSRIRVIYREHNGHISEATNSALAVTQGEFIVLLDHDDQLHVDALRELAGAIDTHPEWDLIYTDEDKLDRNGERCSPYFKPEYNPDLLKGQNCISHLGAFRTKIVRELGGFRRGYEGSQDWDLALRFSDHVGGARIGHVPRVLYHWRISDKSTAEDVSIKPYVRDAALRALSDHANRVHPGARVKELAWLPGHYRVHYANPERDTKISIVITGIASSELIRSCIESIVNTVGNLEQVEFILMSYDGDVFALEKFVRDQRHEFTARILNCSAEASLASWCNQAADMAIGDVLLFVSSGVEAIRAGWLDELASHALRPEVGVVGGKVFDPSGSIREAGLVLGLNGVASSAYRGAPSGATGQMNRLMLTQNVSAVSSTCIAIRKDLFKGIGGFDLTLPSSICSVDLCLRLRELGYLIVWTPFAEFYASEEAGQQEKLSEARVSALRQHWARWLDSDPCYNPNLSLDTGYCELAFPPRR